MKQVDLLYIFKNLKNGDMVGFHYKKWWYIFAKVIKFFTYDTSKKKNEKLAIEHIGICYNVNRQDNELSFNFGEQLTATGRTNNQIIFKKEDIAKLKYNNIIQDISILKDSKATSHLFARNIDFYLLELKDNLNDIQNYQLSQYFNQTENYSVKSAIASVPFFQRILKIKQQDKDNYCSGAVHTALNSIGIGKNIKDKLPSPAELSTFSYIKNIFKINQ